MKLSTSYTKSEGPTCTSTRYWRISPVVIDSRDGRSRTSSTSKYHRLPLYGEFFRHLGVEDQLLVGVSSAASGYLAGFSVERGYPGFSSEDRRIFDALQPHLATAHANAVCYSRALRSVVPGLKTRLEGSIDSPRDNSKYSNPSWLGAATYRLPLHLI